MNEITYRPKNYPGPIALDNKEVERLKLKGEWEEFVLEREDYCYEPNPPKDNQ
jgi:hypothetical protein